MRSRFFRLAVLAIAFLCVSLSSLSAQELSILSSRGAAELLLPGEVPRQAVSGRLVPAGASVAVWVGGSVVVGRAVGADQTPVEIVAGPLTVFTVITSESEKLDIALVAGSIFVSSSAVQVTVRIGMTAIVSDDGEFTAEAGVIEVLRGSITITYSDGSVRVIGGRVRLSLMPTPLRPIIQDR